jgi:hypothetical protein
MKILLTTIYASSTSFGMQRISFTEGPPNGNGDYVIPEPPTLLLLASGLLGIGLFKKKS